LAIAASAYAAIGSPLLMYITADSKTPMMTPHPENKFVSPALAVIAVTYAVRNWSRLFVIDCGMASAEEIALLEPASCTASFVSSQSERDRWLASFADTAAFTQVVRQPSPTDPGQKKCGVDVQLIKSA
jgi:hypothetical protein